MHIFGWVTIGCRISDQCTGVKLITALHNVHGFHGFTVFTASRFSRLHGARTFDEVHGFHGPFSAAVLCTKATEGSSSRISRFFPDRSLHEIPAIHRENRGLCDWLIGTYDRPLLAARIDILPQPAPKHLIGMNWPGTSSHP